MIKIKEVHNRLYQQESRIELDDGWIITEFRTESVTWHGITHKVCEPSLNEHGVRLIYNEGVVCSNCHEQVPDEVLGFHKLCNWRQ